MDYTAKELNRVASKEMVRERSRMMRRLFLTNPYARMMVGEEPNLPPRIEDIIARTFTASQEEDAELQRWIDAEDARYKAKGL